MNLIFKSISSEKLKISRTISIILHIISFASASGCRNEQVPELITPVYSKLKDMSLNIDIVRKGKASCVIVSPEIYKEPALFLQEAIEKKTGIKPDIISDTDPGASAPFRKNLIILGNRSTSKLSAELYDRFYSLMDLKYPGPKGYAVRSLHNPYANGYSAILVGGSDNEGVAAGVQALADCIGQLPSPSKGSLSAGWIMLTRLGEGIEIPSDINNFEIWEASNRYRSVGYFGWNSISKRMAMYYMTGDPFHAREVMRLSFPDARALKEIDAIDGERIENKKEPLAGPYHYNSMMLILFWELIEESPVFSDEERLRVTNSFAKRFEHEGTHPFDRSVYMLNEVPAMVGSRHHQYAGLSILTLAKYFNKYYPSPMWAHAEKAGSLVFAPLHRDSYIESFGDPGSYATGLQPILTYVLLTGDRKPLESGAVNELLRGYEILMNGSPKEAALNAATLDFFNKAAYLTGDGRWITYRERTGMNTNIFRLGQSFWPEESIKPAMPADLAGKWTLRLMPEGMWKHRNNHFTREQSFENISYRSSSDSTGDYVLLKGFNAAYSNPYHTLAIIELRLNGATLLKGYNNQVLTSADGMVEREVPMDAALLHNRVTGEIAAVSAMVRLPFTDWKRTLVQRTGKYVLIADDLNFRKSAGSSHDDMTANIEVQWGLPQATWSDRDQYFSISPADGSKAIEYQLHSSEVMNVKKAEACYSMNLARNVKDGEKMTVFHLLGQKQKMSSEELSCTSLSSNAAVLSLPELAIAVKGDYQNISGELVLLGEKSLYGHNLIKAGLKDALVSSDVPVDIDWDFGSGTISLFNSEAASVGFASGSDNIMLNGVNVKGEKVNGLYTFRIQAGSHKITGAKPDESVSSTKENLTTLDAESKLSRKAALSQKNGPEPVSAPEFKYVLKATLNGTPVEGIVIPTEDSEIFCTAAGKTISLIDYNGKVIGQFNASGNIRVLRWWKEFSLLLAGCDNEEVIAFDLDGNTKWTFTSVMDQAVYEAGKPYWFKSRDPGIYGLYSGEFDNGKSRAFVGSACTLEILDENGQLVKRTPVFWGPGRQFLLVNAKDGSKNLLVGRWRNGYNILSVISSREMKEIDRSYNEVPEGHTFIDGWTSMNRYDNILTDLEGDGKREIVSAINGTWNRVTVYAETGEPLYNAQFGPGIKGPRTNIRMIDVADLDDDGKQETAVALSSGFINVLDSKAEKKWARLLPSAPVVVKMVKDPSRVWICTATEDGSVFALDHKGDIISKGRINGKPADLQILNTEKGTIALIVSESCNITGLRLPMAP